MPTDPDSNADPDIAPEPLPDAEPLEADLEDLPDAFPGGAGQPHTRPTDADAPVPPG